ncbi:MAG TPA: YCF48-related protein [Nevskiaceae bacterium]|nr:YCF48-related protein [Nevskiaceae bacterium]
MRLHSLCGAALALFASATTAEFTDPLEAPAIETTLAAQDVTNALARAGERIVAAGNRGHVLVSDDAGTTWRQARVPLSSDLTALSFPDAHNGWAVGHDGVVLATRDGGSSWTRQLDGRVIGPLLGNYYADPATPGLDDAARVRFQDDAQRIADEGPDKPFLDVWFEDAQHGFAVGAFNLILETTDGGTRWTPWLHRTDNPRNLHLYAIRPAGGTLYIAGEQGLLLRLDRAANRFRAVELPYRGTLFGVTGDAAGVTVFGLRGNAWRSADGLTAWTRIDTQVEVSLTAAAVDARGRTLLASQTGHLLALGAEGAATALQLEDRVPASAVLALPDGKFVIGGAAGLRRLQPARAQEVWP